MTLTLYTRRGCCLCDRLSALLAPHLAQLRQAGVELTLDRRDLDDHPDYLPLYKDRIPVLVRDGRVLLEGRPTEAQVAEAMSRIR